MQLVGRAGAAKRGRKLRPTVGSGHIDSSHRR
jgi:hypothetical protein